MSVAVMAAKMMEMETLVAALQRKPTKAPLKTPTGAARTSNLGKPDPKFEGCWHCAKKGHSRTECMSFKKLLAASGNKVPPGYEGAYEKHKKLVKAHALLTDEEPDDQDEVEFEETEFLNLKGLLCTSCTPAQPSVSTSNGFEALSEEEDEEAVVAALSEITSNISVGPRQTQRQRAAEVAKKGLTIKQVKKIAAAVNRGDVELPDLDLDADDDYEAVWALVDSGAGANVASRSDHFPGAVMDEHDPSVPLIKLSTASAEIIDGGGNFTIHALTAEGHANATTFVDAKVDMPIISVAKVVEDGGRIIFNKKGGTIIAPSGETSRFIKRRGVYFLKLMVQRTVALPANAGFVRPGSA